MKTYPNLILGVQQAPSSGPKENEDGQASKLEQLEARGITSKRSAPFASEELHAVVFGHSCG
jgi:hypothetical protein